MQQCIKFFSPYLHEAQHVNMDLKKFDTLLYLVGLFMNCTMMHGSTNIKQIQ
jgi:hypothetical protein